MDDMINRDIIKGVDALDMIGGSIAKPLVEKIASPIVGNGNFISGLSKIGIAIGIAKYAGNNRLGKSFAIGAGMDGSEDVIVAFGNKAGIHQSEQTEAGVF